MTSQELIAVAGDHVFAGQLHAFRTTVATMTARPFNGVAYMQAVVRCQRAFGLDPEHKLASVADWQTVWPRLCDALHRRRDRINLAATHGEAQALASRLVALGWTAKSPESGAIAMLSRIDPESGDELRIEIIGARVQLTVWDFDDHGRRVPMDLRSPVIQDAVRAIGAGS